MVDDQISLRDSLREIKREKGIKDIIIRLGSSKR